ncbi:MAG: polyprenyl synthetase family protein [Crocinitomicaceae bacterium]|nr:polyprenyl synthetase family protein [Crocinitomicaceae bacterium]
MTDLKAYTLYVESELRKLNFPDVPTDLYEPLRYFLGLGGKRIRPTLTLLGAELFGSSKEQAISQALGIEIFHNFTLVHDDIMDDAPLRRNQTSVHEKWNENVGILTGDIMLIKAYQLLSQIDEERLPKVLDLFNSTAIEVCEGQQHDMDFEDRNDVSIHEYIEMIRLKTSVLLGCALKMGAIVAGASKKDQDAIYAFGQHVGIAFQIQDDILDLYADPEKFGKQVGGDVIANKKTILHLTAISKATRAQMDFSTQLQNESNIELKISRTQELFNHLGVKEECKERMQLHYTQAKEALAKIDVPEERKKCLLDLASYLMDRDI